MIADQSYYITPTGDYSSVVPDREEPPQVDNDRYYVPTIELSKRYIHPMLVFSRERQCFDDRIRTP